MHDAESSESASITPLLGRVDIMQAHCAACQKDEFRLLCTTNHSAQGCFVLIGLVVEHSYSAADQEW